MAWSRWIILASLGLFACAEDASGPGEPSDDAAVEDPMADSGLSNLDARTHDAAVSDVSLSDTSVLDGSPADTGNADGSTLDGSTNDLGSPDANRPDAITAEDAGIVDADPGPDAATIPEGPARLEAVGASHAVGLSWSEIDGATSYTLYWSTVPFVTPVNGTRIDGVAPGFVHRGRTDGVELFYLVTAVVRGAETSPSPQASAIPGGEYELVRLGTGMVEAIAAPGRRFVELGDRVHVAVLAEGYLQSELDVFREDVDDWLAQTLAIEPYSTFEEGFVVWSLPRASAAHVAAADPQTADTAFLVPVTADGDGVSSTVPLTGPTATRVWGALANFPYAPTAYYGPTGLTRDLAMNLVVHILIFDPQLGRSGLSGRARRLQNPSNASQRISAAIAHNRSHEFSHAFARLEDEYLDDTHANNGVDVHLTDNSAYVSNVVDSPVCSTLPWRHLLFGGPQNSSVDQLVGAFGNADSGYHSELLCLMNGTHDNAATYGGNGNLRATDRFCNYCRELVTFRLFERMHILPDPATSMTAWTTLYRSAFFASHGFLVPPEVPQRTSDGTAWFTPCVP